MNTGVEPLATVTVQMPASMKDKLERLARETGRQQTALAVEAINWYLELEIAQIAEIHAAIQRADGGEFASEEEVTALRDKFRAMASMHT